MQHAKNFSRPVDHVSMGLNDYLDIVKHPMDLGTVRSMLHNKISTYTTLEAYAHDVSLVFSNSMLYNAPDSDLYFQALLLRQQFDSLLKYTIDYINTNPLTLEPAIDDRYFSLRKLNAVHSRLCGMDGADLFMSLPFGDKPVDGVDALDLLETPSFPIVHEMDLQIVETELQTAYHTVEEYTRNVLLVFANAMVQFKKGSRHYEEADALQLWFRQQGEIQDRS